MLIIEYMWFPRDTTIPRGLPWRELNFHRRRQAQDIEEARRISLDHGYGYAHALLPRAELLDSDSSDSLD